MSAADDRWAPKVHPLARDAAEEDPLELMAEPVPGGDPALMLQCMLEEFAWMGWNRAQLLSLFHNPGYPMLCELRAFYGDAHVEREVDALLARQGGVLRFRETIVEEPVEEVGLDLVQIQMPPAGASSRVELAQGKE
jgi:hypothetical protein